MAFWKKKPIETPVVDTTPTDAPAAAPIEEEKTGWMSRLKSALSKTNDWLHTDIRDLLKTEGRIVDETFTHDLYAMLIKTDMGSKVAGNVRDRIAREYRARKVHMKDILQIVSEEIRSMMQNKPVEIKLAGSGPTVILVVGVNGAGKTTSIAKLANRFTKQGKRVILGAGDTFRAAAVAQLKIWSERIGCEIQLGESGSDPGSVAFKTAQRAVEEGFDVCIIDTAGRLQTQVNLMQQLEKIRRVVGKQIEDAPHEVLLVLDATAGQNAISQAKGFSEAAGCTGIILAKLDGSAKGGVVVPILNEFHLPVKFIGIGEKLDDLAVFDPEQFTRALLDL
jgi:fused signal recognition particle receptor